MQDLERHALPGGRGGEEDACAAAPADLPFESEAVAKRLLHCR
jgi:hypothetical protein